MKVKATSWFKSFTFLLLVPAYLLPRPVSGIENAFCAGLGYNLREKGYPDDITGGFKSMGFSRFFYPGQIVSMLWIKNPVHSPNSHTDYPDMEVYAVEGLGSDGKHYPLNGWLLLKIKKLDAPPAQFTQLAIWALTDKQETFGQFVYLRSKDCNFDPTGRAVSADNLVPCSATPIDAPMNPNMFVFIDTTKQNFREISVLWKGDSAFCNHPEGFRFMMVTNPDKWYNYPNGFSQPFILDYVDTRSTVGYGPMVLSTELMYPEFYGAASPLMDAPGQLKCTPLDSVTEKKPAWLKAKLNKGAGWSPLGALRFADYKYHEARWFYTPANDLDINKGVDSRNAVCKSYPEGDANEDYRPFLGRCQKARRYADENSFERVFGDPGNNPQCIPLTSNPPPTSGKFYDAVNTRGSELTSTGCSCPKVPTKKEVAAVRDLSLIDAQPYTVEGEGCRVERSEKQYNELGLCKNSAAGRTASSVRKWHAGTILFNVMVLIPMSFFMSRYAKGHIPNAPLTGRPHIPIKAWYIDHVILTVFMTCLYLSGMCSVTRELGVLGHSHHPHSKFHRRFGYVLISTFGFLCITGFLRPINERARWVAIYTHVLGGYLVHYGGAILSILAYRIPASPFAFVGVLDSRASNLFYHSAPTVLLVWLVLDIFFQLYTQIYLIYYERQHLEELSTAPYFLLPIILPQRVNNYCLINIGHFKDLERFLKKLYIGYGFFNMFAYFTVVSFMQFFNQDPDQGFGWMECTHDHNGHYVVGLTHNISQDEILKRKAFCDDF